MNKIQKLYLHIGKPKTGTSSIQRNLGNNRTILQNNSIYYPRNKPYNHGLTIILERFNIKYPIFIDGNLNPDRGKDRISVRVLKVIKDNKFELHLDFTEKQIQNIKEETEYINRITNSSYNFPFILKGEKYKKKYIETITIDECVDIINFYNREITNLIKKNRKLKEQLFKSINLYSIHKRIKKILQYL